MRIVMVTPDVQIDRRIIQEAVTLIGQFGCEIILLANGQAGYPSHEWDSGIKIERMDFNSIDMFGVRGRIILTIQQKIIELLNRLSLKVQAQHRVNPIPICRMITHVAILVNKIAEKLLWVSQHLGELKPYEKYIADRIIYFDPDIIGVHDLPYLKAAVYAKRKLNVPIIYDAHELYPEISTLTLREQQSLRRSEKKLIRCCDQVITVNPFLADEISRRYHVATPNVVLNAINPPEFYSPNEPHDRFRPFFSIPADHKIILFQGWFSPDRGIQHLVEALSLLDETYHLVLMGYGEYQNQLLEIARQDHTTDRLHIKDAVSQGELLFWTGSADVGFIPYPPVDLNHYFCSPNKLFEFIQAGLPIVANDLPYLKQIIEGERFGIVTKLESKEDFANAILKMFSTPDETVHCFKQNIIQNAKKYNWDSQAPTIIKIYQGEMDQPKQYHRQHEVKK